MFVFILGLFFFSSSSFFFFFFFLGGGEGDKGHEKKGQNVLQFISHKLKVICFCHKVSYCLSHFTILFYVQHIDQQCKRSENINLMFML